MKKGVIQKVKQRESGYSIQIENEWFSSFGKAQVKEGDLVEFEFTTKQTDKGVFKNFEVLVLLSSAPKEENPIEISTEKRRILDCVLEVFKKGETKTQAELIQVSATLYKAMEEIYKLNHAGKTADIFNASEWQEAKKI